VDAWWFKTLRSINNIEIAASTNLLWTSKDA
jgi:hypothetical protein